MGSLARPAPPKSAKIPRSGDFEGESQDKLLLPLSAYGTFVNRWPMQELNFAAIELQQI
jgi:hypothetical protein